MSALPERQLLSTPQFIQTTSGASVRHEALGLEVGAELAEVELAKRLTGCFGHDVATASKQTQEAGRRLRAIWAGLFARSVRNAASARCSSPPTLASCRAGSARWEHGRRNLRWSNVVRLAEGLGVSLSELASRAESLTDDLA